jgi:hypothetical protein
MSIIVKSDFFIQNEIKFYEIIRNIKNYQKHFYIFDSYQLLGFKEVDIDIDTDIDIDIDVEEPEPEPVEDQTTKIKNQDYDLILLNYKDKCIFSLFEYIQSLNSLQKIKIMLDSFLCLLDSIQILIENYIVHNNINQNTVNYINNVYSSPILLKFDYSLNLNSNTITMSNLFPYLLDYNPKDIYLPLEFQLLSYLKFNELTSVSKIHIEKIVDDLFHLDDYNYNYNNLFKNSNFKEECYNYLNTFVNKSIETIINEVSAFYYTWDTYKLSIFFLEIIYSNNNLSNVILTNFTELLIKNINPNPLKRPKIENIKINMKHLMLS